MIRIKALTRLFGPITAVDGISFDVDRGEVLGFLGPNGAGKSTTMKMLTGFLAPTSGSASVCGHDIVASPIGAKTAIGYLPEGAPAYPDMTPEGFLRFVGGVRGVPSLRARIADVASLVHITGVMRQPIETLSKGYKRRVGLAQAILHDPSVLILDEPTDGLDPNQKYEVRELIRQMSGEKAIVLSTHILEEVEAVCSRAIVISRGRIVADGTPADLASRSRLHNAVRVSARGAGDLADVVRGVTGVAAVEDLTDDNGRRSCVAIASAGATIAADVSRTLQSGGWSIEELRVERGRLDDVFRSITEGDLPSRGN